MESMEIDDSLYSRQRYVLGDDAMRRMAASRVFLHGLGGVGIEIAKNLCLAGVKGLTIQDDRTTKVEDLGYQFFLRPEDVELGRSRSEACLGRLSELNPYVKVERATGDLYDAEDLSQLEDFQCIILTDYTLDFLSRCDKFCRQRRIRLIACDVFGVFGGLFCDFGPAHEVRDPNGEEPKRVLVGQISRAAQGVVQTLDSSLHDLETGDVVAFREIRGMTELNGTQHPVTVVSPTSFAIGDTSSLSEYEQGGVAVEIKVPRSVCHRSLEEEMRRPTVEALDLGRMSAPSELHLAHLTLLHVWLKSKKEKESFLISEPSLDQVRTSVEQTATAFGIAEVDQELVARLVATAASAATLTPLCAFFGGVAAQEALKAVTGKFTPLRQWLYLDTRDLLPTPESQINGAAIGSTAPRYIAVKRCIGDDLLRHLQALRIFMVGCGAIGCELLKNFALLGLSTHEANGQITMTDHDIIEKSNLNRQFLFREHHIRQPKSKVAAEAVIDINPEINVRPLLDKVGTATESTVFTDAFFESRDLIVNALDNVATRLYVDQRCVANQRPLLESGTMGTKGHVQVIVPHLTETYATQADPPEREFPYCTLKSFPSAIEHCIQWARDKFESQFVQKPQLLRKFAETEAIHNSPEQVRRLAQRVANGEHVEKSLQVARFLRTKCCTWRECVRGSRNKFNKYFNHKAQQLLHSYPVDSRMSDGSLFWQSPKRPPTPIIFDPDNDTHMMFLRSCARLLADAGGIQYSAADLESSALLRELEGFVPRPFTPANKHIETDERVSRETAEQRRSNSSLPGEGAMDAESMAASVFESLADKGAVPWTAMPLPFEKDEDENGHVDFVTAVSNLRAAMYSLEQVDRFRVKRIAGRIVPAIATTTAAVAGLVTIELMRLTASRYATTPDRVDHYRNTFMNLALPVVLLSEPGPCQQMPLPGGRHHTVWDRWDIHLNASTTVAGFIEAVNARYRVTPCTVMQGSKIIYLPFLPNHFKRLKRPILEFLRMLPDKPYVDLLVTTERELDEDMAAVGNDEEEDENQEQTISCPTVRLFIQN